MSKKKYTQEIYSAEIDNATIQTVMFKKKAGNPPEKGDRPVAKKNEIVKVDTAAGSRSFNRFEMQVSQTLHMAIELYDSLNYLLVLDHYDDITENSAFEFH